MRLILSRKGFDSGSGGGPSPILPDGSVLSLPIPDRGSVVTYDELRWRGESLGSLVERLSRGRVKAWHGAHLDPDLRRDAIDRADGWRPTLGQESGAQGHLRNQGVGQGDLFLFWGLFRRLDEAQRWTGPPEHRIWGWLEIGEVASVDGVVRHEPQRWAWAARHPHLQRDPHPANTLYVAADGLGSLGLDLPGAGLFERDDDALRLTAPDARSPSLWSLPAAFDPAGRTPLSYHAKTNRWTPRGDRVELQSVARGQEFVLDLDEYPGVLDWVRGLFELAG